MDADAEATVDVVSIEQPAHANQHQVKIIDS